VLYNPLKQKASTPFPLILVFAGASKLKNINSPHSKPKVRAHLSDPIFFARRLKAKEVLKTQAK
ncbi:hypothetical protein ACI3PL_29770, partial [Lacticaseibacillus paracasei]